MPGALVSSQKLVRVLNGACESIPPSWFMRQAGRYLPEYRQLRKKAGTFLNFCLTPAYAAEATLQPLRRFDLDAAILFADILLVPYGLGLSLNYEEGRGPQMSSLTHPEDINQLTFDMFEARLHPVYETVVRVRSSLAPEIALIGFAGAPWTVATYMIEGGMARDFNKTIFFALSYPDIFARQLDILVEATSIYLEAQIRAGANVIKLFDSWAGAVPAAFFYSWVIEPTRRIVERLQGQFPHIPIIGFPKGAGERYLDFVEQTRVSAVSLDMLISPSWAVDNIQSRVPVQGALDPNLVRVGGALLEEEVRRQLTFFSARPYVFNVGHGILPHTPFEHITQILELIKQAGADNEQNRRLAA
jgi:uroporphyrinogen decarboxylase